MTESSEVRALRLPPSSRRPLSAAASPAPARALAWPLCLLVAAAWPAAQAGPLRLDFSLAAAQLAGSPAASVAARAGRQAAEPVQLSARDLRITLDQDTLASGEVELRQGGLTLTADSLHYLTASRIAIAKGRVQLRREGDAFAGSLAQLQLDTREGFVLDPVYHFARTGAGGQASRIDFIGDQQLQAQAANYTSCPRDGSGDPAWLLSADKLDLNFATNDGRAEGAVLRFLGVPILVAPVLSFPATDERKSGWLPPSFNIDSRAGVDLAVPYYWNIAPNLDATFTPGFMTRRGASLQAEFRYLQPLDEGQLAAHVLPEDRAAGRSRHSLHWAHRGALASGFSYGVELQSASDDTYWKDFSRFLPSQTPRLLPQDLRASQRWSNEPAGRQTELYARVQSWQVLQGSEDLIETPYQRLPQVGLRTQGRWLGGLQYSLETEANRFELRDPLSTELRPNGTRVHALAALERPHDVGWGWLTPRLALNTASYRTDRAMSDGRRSATRTIPSFSLDGGLRYERDAQWFGQGVRQTLEPRLHYVNTPFRDQSNLPLFDTAANDFNAVSIYADSGFSGIDRINDAHQVTVGASTRLLDARTGVERLRLGLAQRYLFREQRVTTESTSTANRFSDLLLFGSGSPLPDWRVDSTVQYSPDQDRVVRSIISARWQPQPFHTLAGTYRYARSLNEQFELGWQWPLYRGAAAASGGCQGTLYGVGRVNYSMKDSRITDSLVGLEYDAGCWIGRIVAERVSTGSSEATSRLMLQLELVGLSRLGSNPLKVLKDNIPGYRLLRDNDAASSSTVNP